MVEAEGKHGPIPDYWRKPLKRRFVQAMMASGRRPFKLRDAVTGLPDPAQWQDWLALQIPHAESAALTSRLATAMVNVDGFRGFNETHGHRAGDELLVTLAQLIRDATGSGDFASRVDGDRFLLAWAGDDATDAVRKLDELRASFRDESGLTLSAGVADLATVHPDLLFRCADNALSEAKRAGRDRITVYRP